MAEHEPLESSFHAADPQTAAELRPDTSRWQPEEAPHPGRGTRAALRVLQVGAIAVVLAAVPWKEFELDRFYVPKELVLHVTALVAGVLALGAIRRLRFTLVDLLLVSFVAAGAVSAMFATNGWLAMRSVAASASAVAIFLTARALQRAGLGTALLGGVALAVVVGVATSLAQTYGVETDFFSVNRAPGGTLGNRNSIAHMAAFGLPIILLMALRARHWAGWLVAGLGATLAAATLVLTRSRAGFLACGAVLVVLAAALIVAPALRQHGRTWVRLLVMVALASAGITAATFTPNALNWRSDNPYLESLTGVANYREGSGRGRLVQYRQSLSMAATNPVLGVGPGNWSVEYPDYAAPSDPSLDRSEPGRTSNPWPSSDWIGFLSERGFPAALLLAFALFGVAARALRRLMNTRDADDALGAASLLAMLLATMVAGMFDAVLLLALPSLLVFAALGSLVPVAGDADRRRWSAAGGIAAVILLFISGIGVLRSAAQLTGMGVYANTTSNAWLGRAAMIDPGNYDLHVRLARRGSGLGRAERCDHATAARDLFPNARQARNLSSGCD